MLTSIDKDKAKTNPSSVFDKPDDVVTHTELQPAEKAVILQEWELEARLTDVAIDEGMTSKGETVEQGCREEPAAGGQEGPTRPRRQADPGRGSADALHAVNRASRRPGAAATHPPVRTLWFSCQTTRHEAAPRSHRHRRRRRRHLPDQAAGRPRHRRHRARGRRRPRRHLVLEPLSRARASTRRAAPTATRSRASCWTSGTGRSASPASPRTCATSTTSPTSSTCASTCSSTARSSRARYDEAENLWRLAPRRRARADLPLPRS